MEKQISAVAHWPLSVFVNKRNEMLSIGESVQPAGRRKMPAIYAANLEY